MWKGKKPGRAHSDWTHERIYTIKWASEKSEFRHCKTCKPEKSTISQKSHICHQQILCFFSKQQSTGPNWKSGTMGMPWKNHVPKKEQWIAWENTWTTHTFKMALLFRTNAHHSHIYRRINCSTHIISLNLSAMPFTFTVTPNRIFFSSLEQHISCINWNNGSNSSSGNANASSNQIYLICILSARDLRRCWPYPHVLFRMCDDDGDARFKNDSLFGEAFINKST